MKRRRLSLGRLFFVLALVAGGAVATVAAAHRVSAKPKSTTPLPLWYAPYVDATNTPVFQFEDQAANPSNDVVLGFVVASPSGDCVPTWGGYYDLPGAAKSLDLDRRIARLRQHGGDVVVSFGGAANDELAERCDETSLVAAYSSVISRYSLETIDLDIEGTALADTAANEKRAAALHTLQARARAAGDKLSVWLTVPVTPQGLTTDGNNLVRETLAAGVDLAGVNVMTMDYGTGALGSGDMVTAATTALAGTWRQLNSLYLRENQHLTPAAIWHKIGMTPMIGQNDVAGERVTVADAERLVALAAHDGIGRVSMWSLNRDAACGVQLGLGTVSTVCSGIAQRALAFSTAFDTLPRRSDAPLLPPTLPVGSSVADNPATSPYPIWSSTSVYQEGAKVTWHHNVFEAKWYSDGNDLPDAPVAHEWETPWLDLGPVLPGDRPVTLPKLAPGQYPAWSAATTYVKGDRIELDGVAYDAKWWTQGDRPNLYDNQPGSSPWAAVIPVADAPAAG